MYAVPTGRRAVSSNCNKAAVASAPPGRARPAPQAKRARIAGPFIFAKWRRLVPGLVHQRLRLDPGHHVTQLRTDFLDRMLGELGAHCLERGLVDAVLQHPVARELAGLYVVEHALHVLL